jgi:hypothetical protein
VGGGGQHQRRGGGQRRGAGAAEQQARTSASAAPRVGESVVHLRASSSYGGQRGQAARHRPAVVIAGLAAAHVGVASRERAQPVVVRSTTGARAASVDPGRE